MDSHFLRLMRELCCRNKLEVALNLLLVMDDVRPACLIDIHGRDLALIKSMMPSLHYNHLGIDEYTREHIYGFSKTPFKVLSLTIEERGQRLGYPFATDWETMGTYKYKYEILATYKGKTEQLLVMACPKPDASRTKDLETGITKWVKALNAHLPDKVDIVYRFVHDSEMD